MAIDTVVKLQAMGCEWEVIAIVADKGFHSAKVVM